jgi:hypothetical protein
MKTAYDNLIDAANIIYARRLALHAESNASPAWLMMRHTHDYLMNQAQEVLRGE